MENGIRDLMTDVSSTSAATPASCADCISRRGFVARSAGLAAVAAFFAACGDSGGITEPVAQKQITVSEFPGLANLNQLVLIDGQRAAKRTGATSFAAFSRACTHEGTAVAVVGSGASFECPNHGARYDNNGHVTFGPAKRDLSVLATQYDPGTDILTIG
jgi:Rieske Fe-S protein